MVRQYVLDSTPGPSPFRVDYAAELNPQQLEVVMAGEGPLLVIAGAGSGKTRTITYRVSRQIESGVPPSAILLVTFTNKAAREMLARVQHLVGDAARRVLGGTFHHVGHMILRSHAERVGYPTNFTIMDRDDARSLLSECVAELKLGKGHGFPKADVLGDWISFAANTGDPLERVVLARAEEHLDDVPAIEKVARRYAERKQAAHLMDFDDLLVLWRRLLQENADVREQYQGRFEHVLVDEYQDTNRLQGELIDLMAGGRRNITAVGDDAQSIYAWRGAHYANILSFSKRYADAQVFKLETNYRSTPQVLDLANEVIAHNRNQFRKELRSTREDGPLPVLVTVGSGDDQAHFIGQRLGELHRDGVPWKEIAILYRAHHHAMKLDLELTRRGIPFVMRSGVRFFEQAHVKDVLAHLRIVANPRDEAAWRRVLQLLPGVGKVTAQKVWAAVERSVAPLDFAASGEAAGLLGKAQREGWKRFAGTLAALRAPDLRTQPAEMIEIVVKGYRQILRDSYPDASEREEDLLELALFSQRFETVDALLGQLSLETDGGEFGGREEEESGAVVLSTIHQAKGLEWQVVFVPWLAQFHFPTKRSMEMTGEALEEERRLFYVAVTRAKDQLHLSCPQFGRDGQWLQPSEFLSELRRDLYERWDAG